MKSAEDSHEFLTFKMLNGHIAFWVIHMRLLCLVVEALQFILTILIFTVLACSSFDL